MLFKTDRLYFDFLQLSDAKDFHALQSNPNVMQFVDQPPMTEEECMADLQKVIQHQQANDGFRVWGVYLKSNQELIGTAAIISEGEENEIGFRLREEFWGKGYGLEMCKGLITFGKEEFGMSTFFAEVDQRNTASIRILDKTMKREREFWNQESETNDYYYSLKL